MGRQGSAELGKVLPPFPLQGLEPSMERVVCNLRVCPLQPHPTSFLPGASQVRRMGDLFQSHGIISGRTR